MRLAPLLDRTHVEPLLAALEKKDVFVGTTAAARARGIGFQSTDPAWASGSIGASSTAW
jgi:hypothetical protein